MLSIEGVITAAAVVIEDPQSAPERLRYHLESLVAAAIQERERVVARIDGTVYLMIEILGVRILTPDLPGDLYWRRSFGGGE